MFAGFLLFGCTSIYTVLQLISRSNSGVLQDYIKTPFKLYIELCLLTF